MTTSLFSNSKKNFQEQYQNKFDRRKEHIFHPQQRL
jgi:hypothetical protein